MTDSGSPTGREDVEIVREALEYGIVADPAEAVFPEAHAAHAALARLEARLAELETGRACHSGEQRRSADRLKEALARVVEMERANRTRAGRDHRCDDCGAAHNLDCSIPSELWNTICADGTSILCVLCIDERLAAAGLTCDEAEFYFVGEALKGRAYLNSHGNVARLREVEAHVAELERQLETEARWTANDLARERTLKARNEVLEGALRFSPCTCVDHQCARCAALAAIDAAEGEA